MRILLIAYYYPPIPGGGSVRPAQWVRHLSELGHEVTVLTATYGSTDLSAPELRIHDPSCNRDRRGWRRFAWAWRRGLVELANRAGAAPSIYSWWRRAAERELAGIVDRVQPEVVLATYSPVECLELGLDLNRVHGLPLVADFRDGLLFETIEAKRMAAYASVRRHYARVEAEVVQRAALITCALPRLVSYFAETYGVETAVALPNAFDPAEWHGLEPADLEVGKLNMVHTGGFAASDAGCDIGPFVAALEQLVQRQPELVESLRLHQLGRLTAREKRLLAKLAARGVVVDHGEVSRTTCRRYQKAADLGLIITTTSRSSVTPGKVFEYLGAGLPVLAVAEGTFAAEIVDLSGCGWVAHPADEGAISAVLEQAITPGAADRLMVDPEAVKQYSVETQTARLERLLLRALV